MNRENCNHQFVQVNTWLTENNITKIIATNYQCEICAKVMTEEEYKNVAR